MDLQEKTNKMRKKNHANSAAEALSEMIRITDRLFRSGIVERAIIEGEKATEMTPDNAEAGQSIRNCL